MFYEHERNGLPVMRPILSEYPEEVAAFSLDNQFMLSNVLLVRPVDAPSVSTVSVYFPNDLWYDLDSSTQYLGPGFQSILVTDNKVNYRFIYQFP